MTARCELCGQESPDHEVDCGNEILHWFPAWRAARRADPDYDPDEPVGVLTRNPETLQ